MLERGKNFFFTEIHLYIFLNRFADTSSSDVNILLIGNFNQY